MPRYRKKPVEIEAIRWTGENINEVYAFAEAHTDVPALTVQDGNVAVETLEGTMRAEAGDWIIRGVHGELYPIKPDIFEETYDPVGPGDA